MSKRCSSSWLPLAAGAALMLSGCGSLPPVAEPEAESAPDAAPAGGAAQPVPQLIGPMPPNLETLETFDEALAGMREEDYEGASKLLEQILQMNPDLVGAHVNLGIARLRLDDLPGARQAFDDALVLRPGHPVVLNQLAIAERRAGRFEAARGLYREALDASPDYAPLHLNMGILCDLFLRQADCALSHYARYVELGGAQAERVGLWIVDLKRRTGRGQ